MRLSAGLDERRLTLVARAEGWVRAASHKSSNARFDDEVAEVELHRWYSPGMVLANHTQGLFQRWLAIEAAAGKPLKQTLAEINETCGTAYRHNWPAKMAESGYSLERIPVAVRRYMMLRVLPAVLTARGIVLPPEVIETLVESLT
ncbi:TPA: hypothetical protein QDC44_001981 [Burkholderia cepacia ATCC 25416]|nr:hypothetical protein [Burkholderia cepacia ATCC 25416]